MLQENISEKSGFVRLALGAGITACGIAHLARNDANRTLGSLLVTAGAMKIAEGIFLYCPTKALISSNVRDAVTTSIEEFMDGDSLMQAFRDHYGSNGNGQSQSQNQGNSNSNQDDGIQQVANAARQAAQTIGTPTAIADAVTQSAKSLSQNGQSQSQNQGNSSSNQGQGLQKVADAATQAAKSMANTGSIVSAATQAAKSFSQNGQSNNKSSQQKQSQNQHQFKNNQNKNISAVQPS